MSKGKNRDPTFPTKVDRVFTSEGDWWNNACLNFLPNGWSVYAFGYKEAGDVIANYVISERRYQDALVFPLVFLYRHYLELELKDLIHQARLLLDIDEPFPKNHRIDGLWRTCRRLLEEISPGDSEESLEEVERLIQEFSEVDPLSIAFRYPEDKVGNPTLPGIRNINLRNIAEVVNRISNLLEGASTMVDEYLSYKSDFGSYS